MMRKEDGFGVGQSIILLAFLVFLAIPLFTSLTGKVFIKYVVHRMNETTDIAVMTTAMELNSIDLSEGKLGFSDNRVLIQSILDSIEKNAINGVSIKSYDIRTFEDGGVCGYGNYSVYDFVHVLIEYSFRAINGKSIDFFIHRDMEIPCEGKVR
jgi:hypothetical protein